MIWAQIYQRNTSHSAKQHFSQLHTSPFPDFHAKLDTVAVPLADTGFNQTRKPRKLHLNFVVGMKRVSSEQNRSHLSLLSAAPNENPTKMNTRPPNVSKETASSGLGGYSGSLHTQQPATKNPPSERGGGVFWVSLEMNSGKKVSFVQFCPTQNTPYSEVFWQHFPPLSQA